MAQPGQLVEVAVLSEELDSTPVTDDLIEEYAVYIGVDTEFERDLFWVAKAGLQEPLPAPWRACQVVGSEDIFYHNPDTQESVWDHPCDQLYKKLLQQEREQLVTVALTLTMEGAPEGGKGALVAATNLAGGRVAEVAVEAPEEATFAEVCDGLMAKLDLPEKASARFLLQSGLMLGYSSRQKLILEVFGS